MKKKFLYLKVLQRRIRQPFSETLKQIRGSKSLGRIFGNIRRGLSWNGNMYTNQSMNIVISLQVSQRDILNTIDREMSGDLKAGFKCIGKSSQISTFAD